jgi:phage host-nuclease inhibitor protein Gam
MSPTATAAKKKKGALSPGLAEIEELTQCFADHRRVLVDRVHSLEAELQKIRRRYLAPLRKDVAAVNDARAVLHQAIDERKAEFEKPKTRTFHGIKVGFRKLVGSIKWDDVDQVVKLIEKNYADDQSKLDLLLKTEKRPVKATLEQLPAVELKRLGVSVEEDSDEVVIKPTDNDVDKLVDALLAEVSEDSDE